MCDVEPRLMAWVDGELSANDAAAVSLHLQACSECRDRIEAYRHLSGAFDQYCDAYCHAFAAAKPVRKLTRRVVMISGGVAVAAAVAMFLILAARWRIQPAVPGALPATMAIEAEKTLLLEQAVHPAPAEIAPVVRIARRKAVEHVKRASAQRQTEDTNLLVSGPAVEIAIPADAIFPPGAVPEGFGFTADVTIAPDGSAQQVRLRPELTEFERRATRP